MATATGYAINIRATDNATGVISKVNTGLATINRSVGNYTAQFGKFGVEMQKLGDVTGINKAAAGVTALGRRIGGAAESLGRFAPSLAGLASAATIGGIAALVEHFTTFGSALGFSAQRAGLQVDALHDLQGAARIAGSSAEALTSGMTALGDNLTNAVAGRSAQTVQVMAALGLSFTDAFGHARSASLVLPEVADRIARLRNPTQQALVATMLFGAAGESLLPFLRRGSAGIEEYNQQAERYGLINEEGARRANEMRMAQTRLRMAVEGVGYAIAERVSPVLVPLLDRLSNYIADNRGGIAEFFKEIAEGIKHWVDTGGLDRLIKRVSDIFEKIKEFAVWISAFRVPTWLLRLFGLNASDHQITITPTGSDTSSGGTISTLPTGIGGWIGSHLPPWLGGHPSSSGSPGSASDPRGLRNNNPLNLEYRGQEGTVGSDGRFGRYASMEAGVAAALRQLQLYQDRDHLMTVGQIIARWAPSSENNTNAYAERVAAALGVNTNTPINLHNPDVAARMISAMAQVENGRALNPAQVQTGVASVTGAMPVNTAPAAPVVPTPSTAPAGAPGAAGPNGQATVRLQFENPPPGLRASTVSMGGVHVETPTLGNVP